MQTIPFRQSISGIVTHILRQYVFWFDQVCHDTRSPNGTDINYCYEIEQAYNFVVRIINKTSFSLVIVKHIQTRFLRLSSVSLDLDTVRISESIDKF